MSNYFGSTPSSVPLTTDQLQDNIINTSKLANTAVTTAKIADSNVTTAKIADDAVETAKLANTAVTTAKIADANITSGKLATAVARGVAKAWATAQSNGNSPESLNITSTTDIGTGVFGLTFTSAFTSSLAAAVATPQGDTGDTATSTFTAQVNNSNRTSSFIQIETLNNNNFGTDVNQTGVVIIGDLA